MTWPAALSNISYLFHLRQLLRPTIYASFHLYRTEVELAYKRSLVWYLYVAKTDMKAQLCALGFQMSFPYKRLPMV